MEIELDWRICSVYLRFIRILDARNQNSNLYRILHKIYYIITSKIRVFFLFIFKKLQKTAHVDVRNGLFLVEESKLLHKHKI